MGKTTRGKKKGRTPGPETSKSRSPAEEAVIEEKSVMIQEPNEGEIAMEEETSQIGVVRDGSRSDAKKVSRERGRPRLQHRMVEEIAENAPRRRRARSRERERSRRSDESNNSRREHRRQPGSISHSRNRQRSTDSRRRSGDRRNAETNHPTDWESLARRGSRYKPGRHGPGERRSPRSA